MTTDLSDLAPAPSDCGTVIIRGPQGEPGEQGPPGDGGHVEAQDPIILDGTGTEDDPYVLGVSLSADVANAIVLGSDGGLYVRTADGSETKVEAGKAIQVTGTGTESDPYVVKTVVSTDIGNAVITGADGGLYVPVSDGSETVIEATDPVTVQGAGTAADPYTIGAALSADTGNTLTLGDDGGLYAPTAVTTTSAADDTVTVTPTTGDVTVKANLSTDTANTLTVGSDGGLYVPASQAGGGTNSVSAADSTVVVDPVVGDVTVKANLSTDTDNTLTTGEDGGLYVPPTAIPPAADSISADTGNTLTVGSDGGLYVPPVSVRYDDIIWATGINAYYTAGYYLASGRCWLRGRVNRVDGQNFTNGTVLGTLPASLAPDLGQSNLGLAAVGATGLYVGLAINADLQLVVAYAPAGMGYIELNGASWPVPVSPAPVDLLA